MYYIAWLRLHIYSISFLEATDGLYLVVCCFMWCKMFDYWQVQYSTAVGCKESFDSIQVQYGIGMALISCIFAAVFEETFVCDVWLDPVVNYPHWHGFTSLLLQHIRGSQY